MKTAKIALMIVMSVVLIFLAGFWYGHRQGNAELKDVRNASSDMRAALKVGVNLEDYRHRVQTLAAAILRAEENHEDTKRYQALLDDYQDALDLWSDRIRSGGCSAFPELSNSLRHVIAKHQIKSICSGCGCEYVSRQVEQWLWEDAAGK